MSQASYCDDTAHRADGAWAAVDVRQNLPRFFVDVTADIACLRELKYMAVSQRAGVDG
jgi:hypothetical protein